MSANSGEVFTGGATTSQHVDAEDDDHFQNTTFKLKRTRSLGLLDEFIDSEQQEKNIEKKNEERQESQGSSDTAHDTTSADKQTSSSSEVSSAPETESDGTPLSPSIASNPPYVGPSDVALHDDTDLAAEPSRHVDYLSHQWDVSDISKSWRYIISRRKNVANAARLENASWRTWAQRRSNLKTISPEAVNWSKESDVTWLYGPIVDDDDHENEGKSANADSSCFNTASNLVAGDISIARKTHRPKPILKKRTVQDMMISHSNLLKLEIASARADKEQTRREDAAAQARKDAAEKYGSSEKPPEYFDYNAISAKLNSQYKNFSQQNSANNSSVNIAGMGKSEVPSGKLSSELQKLSLQDQEADPEGAAVAKQDRHIHFNDEVQQCIAYDSYYADDDEDEYDEEDYEYDGDDSYLYEDGDNLDDKNDDDSNDDDDDEEGGFFLNVRSSSTAQMQGPYPGLSSSASNKNSSKVLENDESSDATSASVFQSIKTIHPLPPTTLNYGSDEESDDYNPYTSSISHNVNSNSRRGYDYYYDYNTVYEVDPNHAIYGDNSKSKTPDVVDVPENMTLGSNFDYEIIENADSFGYDNDQIVTSPNESFGNDDSSGTNKEKIPISSLDDSAASKGKPNPFSLDASDDTDSSDSEEEMGLSISARNSSQSLAQSVFGQPLTKADSGEQHFPEMPDEPMPDANHISSINPNYSSNSLSKQPHSSNSLSDQFFSGGMTKASDENKDLSRSFFDIEHSNNSPSSTPTEHTPGQGKYQGTQSPPVQAKSSAVPPHITSANAFSGIRSQPASKKSFIFNSESESEDELDEEDPLAARHSEGNNPTSYSSLSKVAGESGIAVPNTDHEDNQKSKKGSAMTNFLGSWNKSNSSQ